ncbi:glycosyltransferase family 1 protein [Obesumbacterium proteus]|uniref:Putative glycosyltransferase EpsD n=1 Tax=Hafnia alvei TaxID=569 RepID=A0A172X051_HAFAL|nr:glycosyltransferase family 4 protein [Obesumbacterium proteus]ANF30001.1 putative glycosyltransferase EpsD [Hafnia alvei]TBL73548.1 glycosyltransferase family 1 protein [Obesumbacterium proteus]
MNIVILSNASGYGGSERTIEIIAKKISEQHNIHIYAENKNHVNVLLENGLSVDTTKSGILGMISNLYFMRKKLLNSDCVIGNTNKAGFYIAIMNCLFPFMRRKKTLIFVRDFQWRFLRFIRFALGDNASYCVTTKAAFEYLRDQGINSDIISNPVNLPTFLEPALRENPPIILCPAMISRWKGIDLLIRSLSIIKNDCQLIIIGNHIDQTYLSELKLLVEHLGLKERVVFLAYSKNIDSYYSNCTLVVNSSISDFGGPETFGRTIIEGWAFSKPVVSFDCGGPRYLIDNGINGFLVPEGNVDELALTIDIILSDNELAKKLGSLGYQKVLSEYSVEIVVKKLIDKIIPQ